MVAEIEVTPKIPAYKRPFDLMVTVSVAVILLPLWLILIPVISFAIWLNDRGPIFYTQEGLGIMGKRFRIVKFRTMVVDAEAKTGPIWAQRNDPRVTPVGRLLRLTQLDELPQVVNVLKREMSLVGPRPERPELSGMFERDIPAFRRRLRVQPGIAALSHVCGN